MVIQNIHTKVKYNVTPEEWAGMGTKKTFKIIEEDKDEQTVSNVVPPRERVIKKTADENKTTNYKK